MRKKGKKVIIPEGTELMDYLNQGYAILIFRDDMPPAGCRACGGPYPYCRASCKMFDD